MSANRGFFILSLALCSILFLFLATKSFAQYCAAGTYWCGSGYSAICNPPNCVPDGPNDPFCSCGKTVCEESFNGQCSSMPTQATCSNPCSGAVCIVNGCSWVSGSTGGGGGGGGNPTQPPPPPTQTCTNNYYNEYDQCGGSCNGTSYSANQSDHVVVYKNSCTGNLSYSCSLNATCSTGCNTGTGTCATVTRTYNQCGGNCNGQNLAANVTENITEKNTNGSYTYTCNSNSTCPNGCNTSTGICNTSTRTYNQCGGNCNGQNLGANVTENITATTNTDGSTTFVCNSHSTCSNGCDTGTGQCVANSTPPPTSPPTAAPTQPPQTNAVCNQSYGTCGCSSNCKDGTNTDYSCCHRAWGTCTSGTQACITVFGAGAQQCSNGASQSCSSGAPPTTTCVNPQWQCHTWDSTRCPDGSYYHDERCGTSAPYDYYQFCDGQCPVSAAPTSPPPPPNTPTPPPVYTNKCAGVTCSGCQTCAPSTGTCIANDLVCTTQTGNGDAYCDTSTNKCVVPTGSTSHTLSGRVYEDMDADGIYNSAIDKGVSGRTVNIKRTSALGSTGFTSRPATGTNGTYGGLSGFDADTYQITLSGTAPSGFTVDPATPLQVTKTFKDSDPADIKVDFRFLPNTPAQSTISGNVYKDATMCSGGSAVPNIQMSLRDSGGNLVGTPQNTGSNGEYSFTATNGQTYSINTGNMPGYTPLYVKVGTTCSPITGYSQSIPNLSGNQTVSFYYSNIGPWFQTDFGDVRLGNIFNKVPSGSKASTSTTNPSVFYSTGSAPDFGTGGASAKGWSVGSEYTYNDNSSSRNGSSAYTFYESRAAETGITIKPINDLTDIDGSGVYELKVDASNKATISSSYTVPAGQHIVILVAGDLTINAPMKAPTGVGSLLIVAAKGNITIDPSIGESSPSSTTPDLEGIYTSEKNIILASDSSCPTTADKRLNIGGVLIANALRPFDSNGGGKIQNQRTLCSADGTYPSLFVSSRLDFITQLTQFYKTTYQKWEEVQP